MSTKAQLKSWHETLRELGPRQREVVDLLLRCSQGLSAWEIADRTKRLVHAVRPRLTELRAMGMVREAGERWEPRTERHEAVWKLTPFDNEGQLEMAI